MSSPVSIFRVAKTPRPNDSVRATRIGGGPGRPGFSLSAAVTEEKEEEQEESNGLVWEFNVLRREAQRL